MKNTAIDLIGYDKCTSCFGCSNTCPINGALEMQIDSEGFYKPIITEKCIGCGCCQKGCPVLKNSCSKESEVKTFASWSNDEKIRLESSSGGIFSEVAELILRESGIVYGASWKDGRVHHKSIEKIENIKSLRKSKYLQSNMGSVYKEIKNEVKKREVLFVGLPCQVAALNNIVKSENLLTIDLVCHGVPSLKSYESYVKSNYKGKIKEVNFRNKKNGWSNFWVSYISKKGLEKEFEHKDDRFFLGFLKNIYLNISCYDCKFSCIPRSGDISLADFWGAPSELYDERGVSLVLSNTKKGLKYLKKLKNKGQIELISTDFEESIRWNKRVISGKIDVPKERKLFFKELNSSNFNELSEKYFRPLNDKQKIIKKIKSLLIGLLLKIFRALKIRK